MLVPMTDFEQQVLLRGATASDSEFVYLVKKKALGKYIDKTWGWDEETQLEYHEREFDHETLEIITLDGVDIGWLAVARQDDMIWLHNILILPAYQNRGIGSRLIVSLVDEALSKAVPIRLGVLKANLPARRLYDRLGFQLREQTETHCYMEVKP